MSDYLTGRELAAHLKVSPATIADWTRTGKIPALVVGRTRRYLLDEVVASVKIGVRTGVHESAVEAKNRASKLRRERLAAKEKKSAKHTKTGTYA